MTSPARSPRVSVVMPLYNNAPYVEEGVRSILGQTFQDLELIVVDDGSTDGGQDVVRRLAAEDPRVRLVQAAHGGEGAARNRGMAEARGEMLTWQDADDVATPQRIERQLAAMVDGVDFVHHDMVLTDSAGQPIGYQRAVNIPRQHVLPFYLREGCPYNAATAMIRRSSLGDLRHAEHFRIGVDMDFLRRFAPYAHGVHVPEPLYAYRQHSTSSLATMDEQQRYQNVERLLELEPMEALVPTAFQADWPDDGRLVALAYAAVCLERRGFVEAAVAVFEEVTRTGQHSPAACVIRALMSSAQRSMDEMLHLLVGAPDNAFVLALRGDALAATGRPEKAVVCYRRALQLDPHSYDASAGLRATSEVLGLNVLDDPRRRLVGVPLR